MKKFIRENLLNGLFLSALIGMVNLWWQFHTSIQGITESLVAASLMSAQLMLLMQGVTAMVMRIYRDDVEWHDI